MVNIIFAANLILSLIFSGIISVGISIYGNYSGWSLLRKALTGMVLGVLIGYISS